VVAERNQIFTDADVDAFLAMEGGSVYGAAAVACRAIAANAARSRIALRATGNPVGRWSELAKQYDVRAIESDPIELMDAAEYRISPFGEDMSEYVGDIL
jgi:hypothetical protein